MTNEQALAKARITWCMGADGRDEIATLTNGVYEVGYENDFGRHIMGMSRISYEDAFETAKAKKV